MSEPSDILSTPAVASPAGVALRRITLWAADCCRIQVSAATGVYADNRGQRLTAGAASRLMAPALQSKALKPDRPISPARAPLLTLKGETAYLHVMEVGQIRRHARDRSLCSPDGLAEGTRRTGSYRGG